MSTPHVKPGTDFCFYFKQMMKHYTLYELYHAEERKKNIKILSAQDVNFFMNNRQVLKNGISVEVS